MIDKELINRITNNFFKSCWDSRCVDCDLHGTGDVFNCIVYFTLNYVKENMQPVEYKNKYKEALKNMSKEELCEFENILEENDSYDNQ